MPNTSQPARITVDYSRSVSEIFVHATRSIIAQAQNLNVFCARTNKPLCKRNCLSRACDLQSAELGAELRLWAALLDFGQLSPSTKQTNYRGGGLMPNKASSAEVLHLSLAIDGHFCGKVLTAASRISTDLDGDQI